MTEEERKVADEDGDRKAIRTFRDLMVWQKAVLFVTEIYRVTKDFPREEQFGLVSQMRRSSISIPSNIAEGYGRKSTGDYLRFLQIAMGSIFEIQTQLQIAVNLQYVNAGCFTEMFDESREIERMLSSLLNRLNKN